MVFICIVCFFVVQDPQRIEKKIPSIFIVKIRSISRLCMNYDRCYKDKSEDGYPPAKGEGI